MYEKTLINATLKRIIETSGTNTENLHEDEPRDVREVVYEEIESNANQGAAIGFTEAVPAEVVEETGEVAQPETAQQNPTVVKPNKLAF
jgi:hypothetical protein